MLLKADRPFFTKGYRNGRLASVTWKLKEERFYEAKEKRIVSG
jgi:hypothetical protein